jgi:hypothetical protein
VNNIHSTIKTVPEKIILGKALRGISNDYRRAVVMEVMEVEGIARG